MENVTITRNIDGKVVEFSGIAEILKEKVETSIDARIKREVPLSKITSDMEALKFEVKVVSDVENYVAPTLVKPADAPVKKERKRNNDKKEKAGKIIKEMRTDGKPEKIIVEALMKEFDIKYANAYYYTNTVFAKES